MNEDCNCPASMPAWVMTFADLMSLLLAFFVLLFSFSEMDKNVYKELAGSLKDAFGVQRDIKVKDPPKGINIIAREFSPGIPSPTPFNEVRQSTTDDYKLHPVFTDPSEQGQESSETRNVPEELTQDELDLLDRIKKESEEIRVALGEEINNGLVDMEVKEKQIILRIREKGSFPSGSAKIIEPFKNITRKVSEVFSEFDGTIIVSGHTDNIPIHTDRFRSNWELSASRAVSVIHELSKDNVLRNKHFQLAAFAETQPVDSNDTWLGRTKNRRVEITLSYEKPRMANKQSKINKSATGTAQPVVVNRQDGQQVKPNIGSIKAEKVL
ncbi:MAG: MotB family protein [Gammaproteobacteria bacterium]